MNTREAFEQWHIKSHEMASSVLHRHENGKYRGATTQQEFEVWEAAVGHARASLPSAQPSDVVE